MALLVFLGMTVYTSIWFSYKGLDQSYRRTSEELKYNDIFIRTTLAPDSSVAGLAALDGVEAVVGRLVVDTGGRMPDGTEIKVHLIGLPTAGRPPVNDLYMKKGDYFRPGDGAAGVIESHLDEYYGFEPGDRRRRPDFGGRARDRSQGRGSQPGVFRALLGRFGIPGHGGQLRRHLRSPGLAAGGHGHAGAGQRILYRHQ